MAVEFDQIEDREFAENLTVRIARMELCGECATCKAGLRTYVLALSETEEESWVIASVTGDPETEVASHEGDFIGQRNATALSILFGCSWAAVEKAPVRVYNRQLGVCQECPPRYMEVEPEQLKDLRSKLNCSDPAEVCALLKITEKYGQDPGGTRQG